MTEKQQKDRVAFYNMNIGGEVWYRGGVRNLTYENIFHYSNFRGVPILLRPVSSLTDEEIMKIIKIETFFTPDENKYKYIKKYREIFENIFYDILKLETYDYLRLIGILIPFRDYSIQEILDMGWAKYKETVRKNV